MWIKLLMTGFTRWASTRRHPTLVKIAIGLFILDIFLPNPVPLLDEAILGLVALILSSLKKRATGALKRPVPSEDSPDTKKQIN